MFHPTSDHCQVSLRLTEVALIGRADLAALVPVAQWRRADMAVASKAL
jgi:hypothetical protein